MKGGWVGQYIISSRRHNRADDFSDPPDWKFDTVREPKSVIPPQIVDSFNGPFEPVNGLELAEEMETLQNTVTHTTNVRTVCVCVCNNYYVQYTIG